MNTEKYTNRKNPRLKGFDYNTTGAYFITICTKDRRCLLSRIVGNVTSQNTQGIPNITPYVELTEYGKIAKKHLENMNAFYDNISVESYVIMPNHIHILLFIKGSGQSRTPVPTSDTGANSVFSRFVSTFKRFCNKEYGENIWQSRANDHIIRNQKDYEEHLHYIDENPVRWFFDDLYVSE